MFQVGPLEIALVAIEKWGLQAIFGALGPNGMRSIPPLVRPRELVMTLPAYQYVMLERLAARLAKRLGTAIT